MCMCTCLCARVRVRVRALRCLPRAHARDNAGVPHLMGGACISSGAAKRAEATCNEIGPRLGREIGSRLQRGHTDIAPRLRKMVPRSRHTGDEIAPTSHRAEIGPRSRLLWCEQPPLHPVQGWPLGPRLRRRVRRGSLLGQPPRHGPGLRGPRVPHGPVRSAGATSRASGGRRPHRAVLATVP